MSKVKAATVAGEHIKSIVERWEKLDEEQKSIGSDKRDVLSEAKGVGYDVATIRKIIKLRAMDAADRAEADTLLDTYCHALGMETAATVIEVEPSEETVNARAEQIAAKIAAQVDQCMRLTNDGTPPRIDAIMLELECSTGKASKIRGLIEERLAAGISFSLPREKIENENETPAPMIPAPEAWREITAVAGEYTARAHDPPRSPPRISPRLQDGDSHQTARLVEGRSPPQLRDHGSRS